MALGSGVGVWGQVKGQGSGWGVRQRFGGFQGWLWGQGWIWGQRSGLGSEVRVGVKGGGWGSRGRLALETEGCSLGSEVKGQSSVPPPFSPFRFEQEVLGAAPPPLEAMAVPPPPPPPPPVLRPVIATNTYQQVTPCTPTPP